MTRLQQQPEPFTNQPRPRFGKRPRILTIVAGLVLIAASLELLAQGAPPRNLRIVPPPTAEPPSPTRTGLLASSDLTFLGVMRLPQAVTGSSGALAGRTIGGQVTFFMLNTRGEAFEFPYVGQALDVNAWPVAPVQRAWGWVTWNGEVDKRDISWDYRTGAVRSQKTTGNPWPYFGLAYRDNKLYWSYLDYYNSDYGGTDHCVGVTDLAGDPARNWARGPFRFDMNVKHLCGNLLTTPHGLGLVGSMMAMSRNFDNSWGPALWTVPYPTMATPGGYQSPKLATRALLDYNVNDRAPRAGDYRPDLSNPYNPDGPPPPPGFWTQRDRMSTAVWIETSNGKVGVVFMGGMATGQVWYGSWEGGPYGAVNRCHSADRGENAEGFRAEWRIYDPLDLTGANVRVAPRASFNPKSLRNGDWSQAMCEQYYTGAYFDRASSKLFVVGGYDPVVAGLTVINVWQVNP